MAIKELTTESFEKIVTEEQGLFIIKFFSPTCGPCKTMDPVFKVLAEKNPSLNIYSVDTMKDPEIASHFEVRGVPYIAYCESREILYSFTGITPLGNLQFVINNINDPYFRENGEFPKDEPKKSPWFALSLVLVFVFFIAIILFAQ